MNRIKELREAQNISREDLAIEVGITSEYLRQLETEIPPPTPGLNVARSFATALGVPLDKVFPVPGKTPRGAASRG